MSTPTSQPLAGRSYLITGGSRGIGATITEHCARLGAANIVVNYRSDRESAERLIRDLSEKPETKHCKISAVQGNLKDEATCKSMVDAAIANFPDHKFDGLVLSAGYLKMQPLPSATDADYAAHFDANVAATLWTIKAALPYIKTDGRIVPFSTSVIRTPTALAPGYLLYAMAKGAIEQMVKVLQRDPEVGGPEKRITVNAVAPGATGTKLFYEGKSQELIDRIASLTPEKRIGEPQEIAEVTTFLLTDASRWLRGQTIPVNGAQTV